MHVVALKTQFVRREWAGGRRRQHRPRAQVELREMQRALYDAVLHPPLRQRVRFMGARVVEAVHAAFAEEYRHRWGGVEPEALIGNQVSQPARSHPARCRRWIAHRNTLMLGARTVACSSTILRSAMR